MRKMITVVLSNENINDIINQSIKEPVLSVRLLSYVDPGNFIENISNTLINKFQRK